MKSSVSVTRERHIAAAPDEVWAVVADPAMQERIDSRCRVESTSGDWREVGSEFVLLVTGVRMRYVVAEAIPGALWVANVHRGGKRAAVQTAEVQPDGNATLLRWTVSVRAGALTRGATKRSSENELPGWLAAVEREVLA